MTQPQWDIRNEARTWHQGECWQRFNLIPEKFEMMDGQLCCSDQDREKVLGLLLELVGADRAVQLGSPDVWRAAVTKLPS